MSKLCHRKIKNNKMKNSNLYDVWITADLHLKHKNILNHQVNRIDSMNLRDNEDIENHDRYIIKMWHNLVKRGDHVYVLGDFILSNQQESLNILNILKSKGCKIHLIVGNHDKSTQRMFNMFESIDFIKNVTFKKDTFSFLDEDFMCVMCHYPMKSWTNKCRGAMSLYGHVHNNASWCDEGSDLSLNVGLDNPLCNYRLFNLEEIYSIYKNKLNGLIPKEYIEKVTKEDKFFVR